METHLPCTWRQLTRCAWQHYFCKECIEGWFAYGYNCCPLCRSRYARCANWHSSDTHQLTYAN